MLRRLKRFLGTWIPEVVFSALPYLFARVGVDITAILRPSTELLCPLVPYRLVTRAEV